MSGLMMQEGVILSVEMPVKPLATPSTRAVIYVRGGSNRSEAMLSRSNLSRPDLHFSRNALQDAGMDASPIDFQEDRLRKASYNFDKKEKEIWRTAL